MFKTKAQGERIPERPHSREDDIWKFVASGEATLRRTKASVLVVGGTTTNTNVGDGTPTLQTTMVSLRMLSLNRITEWLKEMDLLQRAQAMAS